MHLVSPQKEPGEPDFESSLSIDSHARADIACAKSVTTGWGSFAWSLTNNFVPMLSVRSGKAHAYDNGHTYMILHFSDLEDETAGKKVLGLDMLLTGIELFRGVPNQAFNDQVETIKWLLKAPPSAG
jgi:hypothetical protein